MWKLKSTKRRKFNIFEKSNADTAVFRDTYFIKIDVFRGALKSI